MSEKRPISEVLRGSYSPDWQVREASGMELLGRSPELLAIVEAAKACTYGHDVTASAGVGPCASCALNTALRAAGEEPTR